MRFVLFLALAGCATSAPEDDPFDATLGAADSAGTDVLEARVGDHLTFSFDDGEIAALHIAGAPAAVIVRKTSGTIDPYALVKNLDKEKITESHDQVIAPALGATDALVGVATDDVITFIASEGLRGAGTLTVDIVPLQRPLPVRLEGSVAQIIGKDLRSLEPARADAVANGFLVENTDGTLASSAPLDQRASITALAQRLLVDRQDFVENVGGTMLDYAAIRAVTD